MACTDIPGNWSAGILLVDTTEDVLADPTLTIFPPNVNGVITGRFSGAGESTFNVRCTEAGAKSIVEFTRVHPDGVTSTHYSGKVIRFVPRSNLLIIVKGRFTRVTTPALRGDAAEALAAVVAGDWETEKPT